MHIDSQKNLIIPQARIASAFASVKQLYGHLSRDLAEAKTLANCFAAWGFQTKKQQDGSLKVTEYRGDGTDAELICTAIAPFLSSDARLTLKGEGYRVRITFTGESCQVKWSRGKAE